MTFDFRKRLRQAATVAIGWIDENGSPLYDVMWSVLFLVILAGLVGALVPYAPAVLFSGHLADSVGTWLAYQCIAGAGCEFYELLGGLALGLYVVGAALAILLLPFWRWLDWKAVEQEMAAEAADNAEVEDDEEQAARTPTIRNGKRPLPL